MDTFVHLYVQRDDTSISFVSLIMGAILLKDKIAFNGTFLRLPFTKCNLEVALFLVVLGVKGKRVLFAYHTPRMGKYMLSVSFCHKIVYFLTHTLLNATSYTSGSPFLS